MTRNAAIYLRRSTDRQEQSIDDQRKVLLEFAGKHGIAIVKEYCDNAISGAMTEERRDFLRMIEEAQTRARPFEVVLVYDVSRFGRAGQDEAGYFRHLLAKAGVEVVYAAEGFNGDETDEIMRPMKQFMAHKMVRDLSKVTIRGQLSRVDKGRWCGGRAPYGYDVAYFDQADREYMRVRALGNGDRELRRPDGTVERVVLRGAELGLTSSDKSVLVPGDPARIETIGRIFDLYVNGAMGYSTIASRLNALGIAPPGPPRSCERRAGWSMITIRGILMNPAYRGALAWNRRTFAKFNRVAKTGLQSRPTARMNKQDSNPEADWIVKEDQHAPLVPPDLWRAAQRAMRMRSGEQTPEEHRRTRRNSPFLLSGLVTCARCGHRFQGYKVTKGRKPSQAKVETLYYACGGYVRSGNTVCRRALVPKDDFEAAAMDAAVEHLTKFVADGGSELLADLVDAERKPKASRAAVQRRLADAQQKLDDAIGSLTPALAKLLESRILELQRTVEDARGELEDIDRRQSSEELATEFVATIVADLARIASTVRAAPFLEQREVLRAITSGIRFDPDTGDAVMHVFAIPRGLSGNAKRPELAALASHYAIAGEGFEPPTSGL